LLDQAQNSAVIPSGLVVIATGYTGNPRKKFVCIAKAEQDKGFAANQEADAITLQLLENVLFTESQRLFKIAVFIQGSGTNDTLVYASDSQAAVSSGTTIGKFFIKGFLNCELKETAKTRTREFYEVSTAVFESLELSLPEQIKAENDLHSYLSKNQPTVSPVEFAKDYLPSSARDSFLAAIPDELQAVPITKDTVLIESKLKNMSILFDNRIKIVGPNENFTQSVEIVPDDDDDSVLIRIRGKIKSSSK
jgi:37-kD nucleoid-associated bacterial protein